MAEEKAGRDNLKPPVCPCLLLSWVRRAFPILASCLRGDITPACCPSQDSAPFPALASQTLLAQTDPPPPCTSAVFLQDEAWSSLWAEPGHVLRTLTQDSNLYSARPSVYSAEAEPLGSEAGSQEWKTLFQVLLSYPLLYLPSPSPLSLPVFGRAEREPPTPPHPPAQACLLDSIVPRGNVQCK